MTVRVDDLVLVMVERSVELQAWIGTRNKVALRIYEERGALALADRHLACGWLLVTGGNPSVWEITGAFAVEEAVALNADGYPRTRGSTYLTAPLQPVEVKPDDGWSRVSRDTLERLDLLRGVGPWSAPFVVSRRAIAARAAIRP